MPSVYRAAVDQIQAALRPRLRERRFRVRGRTFNRITEDQLTQIVGIQMGPSDPPGTVELPGLRESLHGWFTVNIGVYIPEVALYHGGGEAKSWIQDYHCAIRTRLGRVSSEEQDLWWRADASRNIAEELLQRLEAYGLPWLNRFETRDDVLRELRGLHQSQWCSTPRIIQALIYCARGDAVSARDLLAAQARDADATHPHHAEYVRELANRLGIGDIDG